MSDLLKFEGILKDVEPRVTENTNREWALITFEETEETFSTFSKTHMDKLKGNEGEKFTVQYRKSKDLKWNNLVSVNLSEEIPQAENVEARILAKMDNTTTEMQATIISIDQKMDKIIDGNSKLIDLLNRYLATKPA